MSGTGNWKGREKGFAELYQEFGIPAYRKNRVMNYSVSDDDVGIENHPWIRNDNKYTKAAPFKHHGKLREIEFKYCKQKGDVAVLRTTNFKERGGVISVRDRFFAMLLSYWLGYKSKDELWSTYMKEKKETDE
jgi:hypothetical protein